LGNEKRGKRVEKVLLMTATFHKMPERTLILAYRLIKAVRESDGKYLEVETGQGSGKKSEKKSSSTCAP